jgi:N-acetylglucosaminyldiphosphoundecaprenol N-acetyl-beta-D-mannosaminyltransferase
MITTSDRSSRRPPDMELLGLPFHRVGVQEVLAFIEETIARNQKAIALNLNVYCMNLARKHRWLHEFIQRAHLVFCDGDGVRLGLKLSGYSPPPKITYNEWLWQLAAFCESKGYRLYFIGGKPGVALAAATNLKTKHPNLQIVGIQHGYFDKQGEDNQVVVNDINRASPDILLVCLGMPLQERWIAENWQSVNAHVFLKGGAAFDYASGRLQKAPALFIRWHLEWFYRLLQDPLRLFGRYVLGNPYFVLRVLLAKAEKGLRVQEEKRA